MTAKPTMISGRQVRATLDTLIDPDAAQWAKTTESILALEPTPLDRQPSAYVQESWRARHRGNAEVVRVRALVSAKALALRVEWDAARPVRLVDDVNTFADACAVLFPADGRSADLSTMGSPEAPVNSWYWRAGEEAAFSIHAQGIGTVERDLDHEVAARGRWDDGRWAVVLGRLLGSEGVPLEPGGELPVAFAVWSGTAGERAGLKSHTPTWHQLDIGGERSTR